MRNIYLVFILLFEFSSHVLSQDVTSGIILNLTGSSLTISDASPTGHAMTQSNLSLTTDRYGTANSAYLFNGAATNGSYILSNSENFPMTITHTLSMWINYDIQNAQNPVFISFAKIGFGADGYVISRPDNKIKYYGTDNVSGVEAEVLF